MAQFGLDFTNLERYLNSYAQYIIRQAKGRLKKRSDTGNLASTLDYTVFKDKDGNRSIKFFSATYGEFVEKGVRGTEGRRTYIRISGKRGNSPYKYTSKMPPPATLEQWILRKGITATGISGKEIPTKSLAFAIAKTIQRKGIKATSHFTQPLSWSMKTFKSEMIKNFGKDVLKNIILPFKSI